MLSSELKHIRVLLTLRVNLGDTHQGLGHILPTRSENPVGSCLPQVSLQLSHDDMAFCSMKLWHTAAYIF